MENYTKVAKNGFYFDHMNSHTFQVNEVKMKLTHFTLIFDQLVTNPLFSD